MTRRPAHGDAADYYFRYIDLVPEGDVVALLDDQRAEVRALFGAIPPAAADTRHAPGAWSLRELAGHLADTERVFLARVHWFARGFDAPLPSFNQHIAVMHAGSDAVAWTALVDDLLAARVSTVSFLRLLPDEAWERGGVASGNHVTVRALAYLAAGHVAHHLHLARERYSHVMELPR